MADDFINIWNFADAPPRLRSLFPTLADSDWLAEVHPGVDPAEIETTWLLRGNSIDARLSTASGNTVYAGSYSRQSDPAADPRQRHAAKPAAGAGPPGSARES